MKLKNGDIQGAVRPLQSLIQEKFPVSTSYGLVRLVNKMNEPLKVIEDVRKQLIDKYHNEKVGEPKQVIQGTVEFEQFNQDWNELMEQEVELKFDKVKVPLNQNGHELMIEPAALMALDKFIDFEEITAKPAGNRAERRRSAKDNK